jgi:hypothetical protein
MIVMENICPASAGYFFLMTDTGCMPAGEVGEGHNSQVDFL